MGWLKESLTSSLGRKLVMGLTGLFLIVFLLVHLLGNFSLLLKDGSSFNAYAHFMKTNKLIIIGEVVLFVGFLVHIIQGIILVISNKKARPQNYNVSHKNSKVSWTSKLMGPFGVVILVFLIIHLTHFFRYKYFPGADMPMTPYEGEDIPNLYAKVIALYTGDLKFVWVGFYAISMLVIGFHLSHGFQSAFQSLGWNHKKYTPFVKGIGMAYAVLVPLAFAVIPLLIALGIQF